MPANSIFPVKITTREIGDNAIDPITGERRGDQNLVRLLELQRGGTDRAFLESASRIEALGQRVSSVESAVDDSTSDDPLGPIVVRNLDLTQTSDYPLATVADGLAIVRGLWLVAATLTGSGADPVVSMLWSSSSDAGPPFEVLGFDRSPVDRNAFAFPPDGTTRILRATDSLSLRVESAAGHTAFLVDAYLLLEAIS